MFYIEKRRETLSSHRMKNDEHLKFHVISRKFLLYLEICLVNLQPTEISQRSTILLTIPRFNSFYFYLSSIFYIVALTTIMVLPQVAY
jgi:hypothetical protein